MINYATKYATKIAEAFVKPSITADDCGNEYTWVAPNSRTIKIGSVNTVPETEYSRSGDNRFGTTYDIGDTLQEMTCEKAPAFSFTIDALDGTDRAIEVSASRSLRRQLEQVTTPNMDKHRIKKWCMGANIQRLEATAPTKSTIGSMIIDVNADMTNALVPLENRTIYIATSYYKLLKQNPDWLGIESLGKEPYFIEMPLGEGSVPWKEYLAALEEVGYNGFLTIERELGADPAADMAKAVGFLENLIG